MMGALAPSRIARFGRGRRSTVDATEIKAVVRRFYEDVVSTGDLERVPEFVSPDCVETDGKVRVESGIDGMASHIAAVREVYAGLTIEVRRQIAEEEWVATEIVARGRHAGAWIGIKPTGRPLEFTGVNVDRVVDGRIVEHGGAANLLQPLLDAGALRVVDA